MPDSITILWCTCSTNRPDVTEMMTQRWCRGDSLGSIHVDSRHQVKHREGKYRSHSPSAHLTWSVLRWNREIRKANLSRGVQYPSLESRMLIYQVGPWILPVYLGYYRQSYWVGSTAMLFYNSTIHIWQGMVKQTGLDAGVTKSTQEMNILCSLSIGNASVHEVIVRVTNTKSPSRPIPIFTLHCITWYCNRLNGIGRSGSSELGIHNVQSTSSSGRKRFHHNLVATWNILFSSISLSIESTWLIL